MAELYNHKVVEKNGRKSGMMRKLSQQPMTLQNQNIMH